MPKSHNSSKKTMGAADTENGALKYSAGIKAYTECWGSGLMSIGISIVISSWEPLHVTSRCSQPYFKKFYNAHFKICLIICNIARKVPRDGFWPSYEVKFKMRIVEFFETWLTASRWHIKRFSWRNHDGYTNCLWARASAFCVQVVSFIYWVIILLTGPFSKNLQ